jgi:hypothetical protein
MVAMTRLFWPHVLLVGGGGVIGLFAGIVALDTEPAIFGWLFGAGAGITGGAFIAAVTSGQQIVSGPAAPGSRTPRPTLTAEEFDALERELPHLLDGIPPRDDE